MFANWTGTVSFKALASHEKDSSSVENLLQSSTSSLEENRHPEELRCKCPPLHRSQRLWTVLNLLLFLFSLLVLSQQMYQNYFEAHDMNSLLKKTSYFCKELLLSLCIIIANLQLSPNPRPARDSVIFAADGWKPL
jgi:hypothetical protein